MIYYNSKCLSESLEINLSKWKRWVRELLPPDPLGGLQSGYARQFNLKEAFRVYLGGLLVGSLHFSIPETRQLLVALDPDLERHGFYSLYPRKQPIPSGVEWLTIYTHPAKGFECHILGEPRTPSDPKCRFGHVMHLGQVYLSFLDRIDA